MTTTTMWEQSEVPNYIPVYHIEMNVTRPDPLLLIRGDQHIGLKCVDLELLEKQYMDVQNEYRDNVFVLEMGDLIENGLKRSIGHNYDIALADPEQQIEYAVAMQNRLDENLYGSEQYKKMKPVTRSCTKHARRFGVLGNHEYRSRREAGIWLNKRLYGPEVPGCIDGGIHGIVSLKLINKKLKLNKTYKIYVAHRLTNSSAGISHATMNKNFGAKKGDIEADIYVCGHYHREFISYDTKYTSQGKRKKVSYVCCPSPAMTTEYGTWAMYSPAQSGFYSKLFLPLGKHEYPFGNV